MKIIFTAEILNRLQDIKNKTPELRERLEILLACGPFPSDPIRANYLAELRGRKAAWQTYIDAARACGLLQGELGKEIVGRLTGKDDQGFRSAISECMVCWYFAGKLKLMVTAKPTGRDQRVLEMAVELPNGKANIEVKAPANERREDVEYGDESGIISHKLKEANKQFSNHETNILLILTDFFGGSIN